ncbi:MAG: HK97 family phage prohead protease, partial [Sphingomonadaceae bacterium]|nr:HK97 family phage prohead protease [Sphingomonadaceae bacterium]
VARGDVRGLSVGYRVRAARGEGPRELIELALVEVSLVARPMQPLARVHALEAECDRSCECEESRSRR